MYSSEFRDIDLTTRNESHNFSNIPATKPTLSPLLDGTKMIDAQDTELSHEAVTTADDGSNPNAIEYERTSWGHPVEDMSHPCAPDVDSGQPMPFRRGMRNHNVLDCLSATTHGKCHDKVKT